MTKTSIYCYEKNGGICKNRVSLANNYICGAGHGGVKQGGSVSSGLLATAPVINLAGMNVDQRRDIALDLSTPPETLAQMARDRSSNVRRAVAGNTSTPPETLAQMVGDEEVRHAVADNIFTPLDAHIFLAKQGYIPYGLVKRKPIDKFIGYIHLVDQYPNTFGEAYLDRLVEHPSPGDKAHPKRRALIGYVYAKFAESDKARSYNKQLYKDRIKVLFPDDQEMAEIVGY